MGEKNNFVNATDEDGKAVPFEDKRITIKGSVDTSKPDVYEVTYSFKGKVKTVDSKFKVTVKEDKSSIETKDSILYEGESWKAIDNFTAATDEEGHSVSVDDERININDSEVNTSRPGVYNLKYSFKGKVKTSESTFKVIVKLNKATIKTKDSALYVGQKWSKEDNFIIATDESGKK